MTGTETWARTEGDMSTGMSTRVKKMGTIIYEGGGEREPASEDARRWATRTSNLKPQPQDPTLQRDHRIILRTINRVQGRKARDRIGEGGGEAKKRMKP